MAKKKREEKFKFDRVEDFDDHIRRSILGFEIMDEQIKALARYFLEDETNFYDVGCSTGKRIFELREAYSHLKIRYVGIDYSRKFIEEAQAVLGDASEEELAFIFMDLGRGFKFENASMITSVFTLQFMPIADRKKLLEDVYDGLRPGGAFVFGEKVLSRDIRLQEPFNFQMFDFKRRSFSTEEILEKERQLRGFLKPLTLEENLDILREAGFANYEIIWKVYNFLCLLLIK